MRVEDIPFVGPLLAAGADDRVFDALLVLGLVAILLITVLGRSAASIAIAIAYAGGFIGYVIYKSFQ